MSTVEISTERHEELLSCERRLFILFGDLGLEVGEDGEFYKSKKSLKSMNAEFDKIDLLYAKAKS